MSTLRIRLAVPFALVTALATTACRDASSLAPDKARAAKGQAAVAAERLRVVTLEAPVHDGAVTEVVAVFNHPMVRGEVDVAAPAERGPFIVATADGVTVEGDFRWLGRHASVFLPRGGRFQPGRYSARVADDVKSLAGVALNGKDSWTFDVPEAASVSKVASRRRASVEPFKAPTTLMVVSAWPYNGMQEVARDVAFRMRLNAAVYTRAVEENVRVRETVGTGTEKVVRDVAVVVSTSSAWRGQTDVYLRPKAGRYTAGATVGVELGSALPDASRALTLGIKKEWSFSVVGEFGFRSLACETACAPGEGLGFAFNSPVRPRDVWKAVRVKPSVRINEPSDNDPSTGVTLYGAFKPKTRYGVTLDSSLKGEDGVALGRAVTTDFETRGFGPKVQFAVDGSLLESKGLKGVPVVFQSVPEGKVEFVPIPEERVIPVLADNASAWSLRGVVAKTLKFKQWDGERFIRLVDPTAALGRASGGVVAIRASAEGPDETPSASVFEVKAAGPGNAAKRREPTREKFEAKMTVNITNLGVTTKRSPFGLYAWVTLLSKGEPVSGARVAVRNKRNELLWTGETDGDGLAFAPRAALLPKKGPKNAADSRYWVFAATASDFAYVNTDENQWMMTPSSFDIPDATGVAWDKEWSEGVGDSPKDEQTVGMLFTDRGIYRPGEKVRVKGIIRRAGLRKMRTPEGEAIEFTVKNERGDQVALESAKLSAFGTFAFDVNLPENASLGAYQMAAEVGEKEPKGKVEDSFRVEQFKTPDFQVTVKTEKKGFSQGEAVKWRAEARYLFGAPMRAARLHYTVTRHRSYFAPPNHPGFFFGVERDWWSDHSSGELAEGEGGTVASQDETTDDSGAVEGAFKPELKKVSEPVAYAIEASVTGLDRQEIATRTAVTVHPADFYVGALAEWTFLESTETFRVDLAIVSSEGTRLDGVPVTGEVLKRTWRSWRRENEGGTGSYGTRVVEELEHSCKVTSSSAALQRCTFKPREGGSYVFRATATDSKGRKVVTSFGFHVMGPTSSAWAATDDVKIGLVTDKREYTVGDTARIIVKSPFPRANALVTVEREGVIWQKRMVFEGASPSLRIPVTEEFLPNAFVSVALVRGRVPGEIQTTGDDPRRPMLRVGYATIKMDPKAKRLKVAIAPDAEEKRPGDEVTVKLRATSASGVGVRAELTVSVVDEGVLSLIGYKTPDPIKAMYVVRGLAVRTSDNRYRYMRRRAFEEKGESAAGDGRGRSGLRSRFEASAYFNPSVVTDENGDALVKFRLPDNLTTFRVMAVAASTGDEFGSGEAKFRVAKPLVMMASLPRFARAGDKFEAGVVVHNHTRAAEKARVTLDAKGVTLAGPPSREVELAAGKGVEVRFPVVAGAPGRALFQFRGKMGDHEDGVEVAREVKVPGVVEAIGWSGIADSTARHTAVLPGAVRKDTGALTVSFSASERVELMDSLAYLIEYPYGCAEQTTSTLTPLLGLRDLTEGMDLARAKEIPKMVRFGVKRLYQFQHEDGGFSLWGPSSEGWGPFASKSEPWLSAWVLWALAEARRAGYDVDDGVVKAGVKYLKKSLSMDEKSPVELAEKAYVAYVLAALGAPEPAANSHLFDVQAKLPVFAKAFLAHAMHIAKDDRVRIDGLVAEVAGVAREVGDGVVFGGEGEAWRKLAHSEPRTNAVVLGMLNTVAPEHPLAKKVARGLLAARANGRWLNTQENAYALLSLSEFFKRTEKAADAHLTARIGDTPVFDGAAPAGKLLWSATVPIANIDTTQPLAFFLKAKGSEPIRYRARLRYALVEPQATLRDDGIAIWKTVESLAGKSPTAGGGGELFAPSATEVPAGELVRVNLTIIVPKDRKDLVVDDALPAGLEAVNFNLVTTRRTGREGDARERWWTPFYYRENRDDRVVLFGGHVRAGIHRYRYLARATTPGDYGAPPTHSEEMYDPRVNGRGKAGRLMVVAK